MSYSKAFLFGLILQRISPTTLLFKHALSVLCRSPYLTVLYLYYLYCQTVDSNGMGSLVTSARVEHEALVRLEVGLLLFADLVARVNWVAPHDLPGEGALKLGVRQWHRDVVYCIQGAVRVLKRRNPSMYAEYLRNKIQKAVRNKIQQMCYYRSTMYAYNNMTTKIILASCGKNTKWGTLDDTVKAYVNTPYAGLIPLRVGDIHGINAIRNVRKQCR